ncbi:MAG: response regulator [Candidatus Obscuribacterales bacterium]|nr:response regulator [Steroidobacteraceae bacterium]
MGYSFALLAVLAVVSMTVLSRAMWPFHSRWFPDRRLALTPNQKTLLGNAVTTQHIAMQSQAQSTQSSDEMPAMVSLSPQPKSSNSSTVQGAAVVDAASATDKLFGLGKAFDRWTGELSQLMDHNREMHAKNDEFMQIVERVLAVANGAAMEAKRSGGNDHALAAVANEVHALATRAHHLSVDYRFNLHKNDLITGSTFQDLQAGGKMIAGALAEKQMAERALLRQSRMFAALSATNEALMRVASAEDLYQRVCDAAVSGGKFQTATVNLPDPKTGNIRVAAIAGVGQGADLSKILISVDPALPEGRGLVGETYRTQAPAVCNDVMSDERLLPWRQFFQNDNVSASAAFPLIRDGTVIGVLMFLSNERHAFDAEIVKLMQHMARNIVFGLDNLAAEEQRKQAEQQLQATQARLNRATTGANDGLWEYDLQTSKVWVSPRFAEMLGYDYQVFLPDKELFSELTHVDDRHIISEAFASAIKYGVPVDVQVRALTYGGEQRWMRVRGACIRDADNTPTTIAGSQQDVTELRNYQLALIEATKAAAAANQAKSEFLANMSHEIRTPMNGVIGMTELQLETPLNAMQRDYANTVKESAAALLTVINDILDFSKVEAGKIELELLDIDLRDTIEDVARLLAIQAHAKGLEVIALLDPGLPDLVRGDAGRLRQVLLNLCGNAVKFTQKGEVSIGCSVAAKDDQGVLVRCEVHDTGIGIPPDRLDSLFQAFSQVDASTTRKFGGTGLGLSIVKRLVELMGGEVGVSSEEGKGSTFWFTARLGIALDMSNARPAAPIELKNQRVIIVDDNATNRKVIMGQLGLCAMDAICASSAEEALMLMREAAEKGKPFEVALLDHQMPGYDGAMLGKSINSDPLLKVTRLVLLTSSGQRGDGKLFAELGFAGYLLKPVTQRDLIDCLTLVLGVRSESWQNQTQPIVTRHLLRSQRSAEATRILLAEDNVVNQKVACRTVEKLGYKVDVAPNGQAAVEAWATGRYDLILMDCQMPVMDGYEATRTIRSREPEGKRIPIIALTAHAMKGSDDDCAQAGMDDYLTKPIDRELMRACLERWSNIDSRLAIK